MFYTWQSHFWNSGDAVKVMDGTLVTESCLPVRRRGTGRTEIMLPIRLLAFAIKFWHLPLSGDTCH